VTWGIIMSIGLRTIALGAFFLIFGAAAAWADLVSIALSPPPFTVMQGETDVEVFGTLTNITNATVFINGDDLTVPGASSITDLFLSTPPFLRVGQNSWLIELFSFDVLPDAAIGSQFGSYVILGGVGQNSTGFDVIGSQTFEVTIEPAIQIPEPNSFALLVTCLCFLTLYRVASRRTL
jgi:hypothetical protein